MTKKIRVLIVDDSIFFRKVLSDKLAEFNNIEVIGFAVDAFDAKEKIIKLNPDVVTLDVEMPRLSGIDFVKQFIPTHPVRVVLVSAININVFDALSAGAVDFVKKPELSTMGNISAFITELHSKIVIARSATIHSSPTVKPSVPPVTTPVPKPIPKPVLPVALNNSSALSSIIIAIGASTGGTEATLTVLKGLPSNIPGIVVVQHMPAGFTKMYADRLNKLCKMEVREAVDGDIIKQGLALIAPGGDNQMKVVKQGGNYVVKLFSGEKVSGHRPSVDVLFQSIAENVKNRAVGIIMTGMGRDGADGLLKMRKNGAYTIGQNKESCVVYGMPMVAYNIGAVTIEASAENIPAVLQKHLSTL
ncbi:MAG: chemotaxis response regulator protein-glutamate methylesterase [Lachnospiraceae bacterium]|nr:chemotaxis response regulator protein-glutamate methylesterase [Lachnospiraceae bacterium]